MSNVWLILTLAYRWCVPAALVDSPNTGPSHCVLLLLGEWQQHIDKSAQTCQCYFRHHDNVCCLAARRMNGECLCVCCSSMVRCAACMLSMLSSGRLYVSATGVTCCAFSTGLRQSYYWVSSWYDFFYNLTNHYRECTFSTIWPIISYRECTMHMHTSHDASHGWWLSFD